MADEPPANLTKDDWYNDDGMAIDRQQMYEAISELGYWNKLRTDQPDENRGFMFSSKKWMDDIYNHPKVEASGHSGASGALLLREMEYIATNGWKAYAVMGERVKAADKYKQDQGSQPSSRT
jgi:hypothetical protein